ncbi:MAG: hypothetical protein IJB65_03505 [Clostridia bacterium]|nr:hypothetical protein [Clostridia bacterium]
MKKVLCLVLLFALMVTSFVACDKKEDPKTDKESSSVSAPSAEESKDTSASTEDSAVESVSTEDSAVESVSTEDSEVEPTSTEDSAVESTSTEDSAVESTSTEDSEVALGGDDALVGAWEATEDGVTVVFAFEADGKGKMSTMGISMDLTWSVVDGKLSASATFMGETEEMLKDAEYTVDGDSVTITYEGEALTLTRSTGAGEESDETSSDMPLGGDDALVGAWEATEDGVTVVFTFEADGKGKMESMGVAMDLTWSVVDGKLNASMSFMGETEEMLKDAEYTIDGDSLTITSEGEPVTLTKKA